MPNPKNKFSKARRDHRRANWKLTPPTLVKCNKPDCDGMHLSHHVCPKCGTYGPEHRQVLAIEREA